MEKRISAIVLSLVLAGSMLSACVSKPDETSGTGSDPMPTPVYATDRDGEPGTAYGPDEDENAAVTPEPAEEGKKPENNTGEPVKLREFCADEELDAWFDNIQEDTPVKLEYWVFGEGPYSADITDRDLILKTVSALQTVTIDGLSEENPDWTDDAGGTGYYFEMEDGTKKSFSFMMGCFRWNNSEYHDVANFGDLRAVSEELERIANPRLEIIFSEDEGYYTRYIETYTAQWSPEQLLTGGIDIYLGEAGAAPGIEIARCVDETPDDPEGYLVDYLVPKLKESTENSGTVIEEAGEVQDYKYGGKTFIGQTFNVVSEDGNALTMQLLILTVEDDLLEDKHLVRFSAVYDEETEYETLNALETAAKEFCFRHTYYEKGEVQPDNLLLDFINDPMVTEWFERFNDHPSDSLFFTTETWHMAEDPETIKAVLEALKNVRIGDVNDEIIGASGRRIYEFMYHESGESAEFEFYKDTFYYDGKNYTVLDWGTLKDFDKELLSL